MTSGLLNPVEPGIGKAEIDSGRAKLIDLRESSQFIHGHIAKSIYGILEKDSKSTQFRLLWIQAFVPKNSCVILLTNIGDEECAYKALADNGYTQIRGYLDGGFAAWKNSGYETIGLDTCEASQVCNIDFGEDSQNVLLDIRTAKEWDAKGVHDKAKLIEFKHLKVAENFDVKKQYYVMSNTGRRSVMASSYLKALG